MQRFRRNPIAISALFILIASITVSGCRPEASEVGPGQTDEPSPPTSQQPAPDEDTAPGVATRYTLAADGDAVVSEGGEEIPLEEGAVDGFVGHWKSSGDTAELAGWAADVEGARPADTVIVVRDGTVVLTAAPDQTRTDVAEHHGEERLADSGFQIEFPADDDMEVRVLAVVGHTASELPYREGFPWPASERETADGSGDGDE